MLPKMVSMTLRYCLYRGNDRPLQSSNKTVNLSPEVYNGRSVAAASVLHTNAGMQFSTPGPMPRCNYAQHWCLFRMWCKIA